MSNHADNQLPLKPVLPVINTFFPLYTLLNAIFILLFLSFPIFPRCFARSQEALQFLLVTQRVHALPKAMMLIAGKLPPGGKRFKRFTLPGRCVIFYIFQCSRLHNHETSVDPSHIIPTLFTERPYHRTANVHYSETTFGKHTCQRDHSPCLFMKPDTFINVNI